MKTLLLISTFLIASLVNAGTIGTTPTTKKSTKTQKTTHQDSVSTKNAATAKTATAVAPAPAPVFFGAKGNHPFQNEIVTNFTSGGLTSMKPCKSCSSSTDISVAAQYLYYLPGYLQNKLQVGGEAGIGSVSAGGSSSTEITAVGVGVYNLENDFKNSPFVKAGLGLYTVGYAGNTETKLGLFVGGGKRFAWLNNVTLTPEARIIKKGDLDFAFEVNVLNFSIYWN